MESRLEFKVFQLIIHGLDLLQVPFGLKILIDIAKLFDVETPEMNKVWKWYLGTGTIESVFEMPVDKEQFIEFYK